MMSEWKANQTYVNERKQMEWEYEMHADKWQRRNHAERNLIQQLNIVKYISEKNKLRANYRSNSNTMEMKSESSNCIIAAEPYRNALPDPIRSQYEQNMHWWMSVVVLWHRVKMSFMQWICKAAAAVIETVR